MTTNFPTSLDSFTNPTGSDALGSATVPHATQHANVNDAVEALEAKVGVDGSAVTTSLDYKLAQQGLVLVKTQTIGSGVSSVTVSDAFSSTFDNYRIVTSGTTMSVNTSIQLRLGASATGYYNAWSGSYYTATANNGGQNNQTAALVGGGDSLAAFVACDVFRPFASQYTIYQWSGAFVDAAITGAGRHAVAASYSDFTFLAGSGTMTGGTIRVYGYNNG